jgi:hypothetical protein
MMRQTLRSTAVLLACAGSAALAFAAEPPPGAACPAGYQLIAEVQHRVVIKRVCRQVPDVKKVTHWVYDCQLEDFCKAGCPLHGAHPQADCPDCAHKACCPCGPPGTRHLLLKRLVTEECPTTKCVVECTVEHVPCVVYRKVPCATSPVAPPAPVPAGPVVGPPPASPDRGFSKTPPPGLPEAERGSQTILLPLSASGRGSGGGVLEQVQSGKE